MCVIWHDLSWLFLSCKNFKTNVQKSSNLSNLITEAKQIHTILDYSFYQCVDVKLRYSQNAFFIVMAYLNCCWLVACMYYTSITLLPTN